VTEGIHGRLLHVAETKTNAHSFLIAEMDAIRDYAVEHGDTVQSCCNQDGIYRIAIAYKKDWDYRQSLIFGHLRNKQEKEKGETAKAKAAKK